MRTMFTLKAGKVLGALLILIFGTGFHTCAQPANDNFCFAIAVQVNALNTPGDCSSSFAFDNTGGTVEVGEPVLECFFDAMVDNSVWFSSIKLTYNSK